MVRKNNRAFKEQKKAASFSESRFFGRKIPSNKELHWQERLPENRYFKILLAFGADFVIHRQRIN